MLQDIVVQSNFSNQKECRIYINKVLTIYLYIHILIYILLFLKINCNFLLFMSRKLYASGIKVYLRKKSVLILCERQYCKIYKNVQLGMMVCRLKCVHSGFLLKRRCPLTFFQKNGVEINLFWLCPYTEYQLNKMIWLYI